MNAITPPFLKSGDTIGIAATARWISQDVYQRTSELFNSWGFKTVAAENIFTRNFQLAGTDDERALGLQQMLDDNKVKAIMIARGGYGTARVIDKLDFSNFLKNPKWICGYSDITVLHAHLNSIGIPTIHSTMPVSFDVATDGALENLRMALKGELKIIDFGIGDSHQKCIKGLPVLGGNLSVLNSLLGSASMNINRDHILFLEDVEEMFYHVDRMIMALKRANVLQFTKAILVGGMTRMKDNTAEFGYDPQNPWGLNPTEILQRLADEIGIPVYNGFPAGHENDNRAFFLGLPSNIEIVEGFNRLQFQHS